MDHATFQATRTSLATSIASSRPDKTILQKKRQETISLYNLVADMAATVEDTTAFAKHIRNRVAKSIRAGYVIGMGNRPYIIPAMAVDCQDDIAQDILTEYLTRAKQGVMRRSVSFGRAFQKSARKLCNRATGYWVVRLAEYNANTGRYVLMAPDAKLPSVAQRRQDNEACEVRGESPRWLESRHSVTRWDDVGPIQVKKGTEYLDAEQSEHTRTYALKQASDSHAEGYAIIRSILSGMDYRTITRVCGVSLWQVQKVWGVYVETIKAANEVRISHKAQ